MRTRWALALWLAGAAPALALDAAKLDAAAKAAEAAVGGRFGAAVLDTGDGTRWSYGGDARFPLASTHKAFSCAALLAKVDRGETSLARRVTILATDVVPYSPITQDHIAPDSMSLADYCAAALSVSDNTAANVVMDAAGGPAGVTAFFRSLGDDTSRLDRHETELNSALPGDPQDTTTPAAAVADLDKILDGGALKPASRLRLVGWMEGDKVAGGLLRKSMPEDWRIADKTGAGERGARGIVAAIWPPNRPPLIVAVYMTDVAKPRAEEDAAIARFGAALVEAAGK